VLTAYALATERIRVGTGVVPIYIRDVVVPAVRAGRERVGKDIEGFEIVAAVPAALTDDKAEVYDGCGESS
jgi:hypothetical protein